MQRSKVFSSSSILVFLTLVAETQERLKACSYTFGHPDTGELIPACVQHSVLDPAINKRLKAILPLSNDANGSCGCSEDLEW